MPPRNSNNSNSSAHIQGLREHIDIIEPPTGIEPVTGNVDFKDLIDDESFMHEDVKVSLFPTTDANAPPYAVISVNGDRVVIPRARPVFVKRKHLEVLARLKETRWVQNIPEGYVGQVGAESLQGHTAQVYPFQVLEDKNPRGPAWLEHILAERE